ncbi:type II secretion system protein [Ammoniphilus sp. YIM 78166]|uniref:type II secretion system protein n=1 Tax=Ammoniphilus sp. YIM 78166 TaxID=1644106 RepID=UPI0014302119|nr:prepilin-type N-terminal cleavage/methylation domain-containing protein [Ammoniphilus sp. YIM 78166]
MVASLKKLWNNQRGVTLIELLAVVVILGIIAAIAAPSVITNFSDAKKNADSQTEKIVIDAAQRYMLDDAKNVTFNNNSATITIAVLKEKGYLTSEPKWSDNNAVANVVLTQDATTKKVTSYSVSGKPSNY